MSTIITCVYCGKEYPTGTPSSGSEVSALTDHIRTCEKHPMRSVEAKLAKVRSALAAMIGADGKAELEQMECAIRLLPAPQADKVVSLDAIHALIETLP